MIGLLYYLISCFNRGVLIASEINRVKQAVENSKEIQEKAFAVRFTFIYKIRI